MSKIIKSSGNVFADIGVPNAKQHALKADLVIQIQKIMKSRSLTQTAAAERMHISQGDLSKMLRGHFEGYSIERLLNLLARLGHDITIGLKPARKATGVVTVTAELEEV